MRPAGHGFLRVRCESCHTEHLFAVIQYLQEQEGIHLEVKARKVA
jgi:hypothetical protein